MGGDTNRPALAFEYEISLALVDSTQALGFNENPYPPILGQFEYLFTTSNIRLSEPTAQYKALANGYNPCAQLIPVRGSLGSLGFEIEDRPAFDRISPYLGRPCVAQILTRIDQDVARIQYCCYWTPTKADNRVGAGEDVGSKSVEGQFLLLTND